MTYFKDLSKQFMQPALLCRLLKVFLVIPISFKFKLVKGLQIVLLKCVFWQCAPTSFNASHFTLA